jgi:hypothetical protein
MLSSTNTSSSSIINYSSVSCWPVLEPALNQLFPPSTDLTAPSTLGSDEYLKLYTVVFEHCVGSAEGKKAGVKTAAVGLNISGEELYMTLVKYLETRLNQWSQYLMVTQDFLKM